jgi:hypothetical protein
LRELAAFVIDPAWTTEQAAAWWSAQATTPSMERTAFQERSQRTPGDTDRTVFYDRPQG